MGFIHKIIISFSLFLTLSVQLHAQNFTVEPGEWSFLGADGGNIVTSSDAILSDSSKVAIIWKYDKNSGWSAYSPDTSMNLGSYSNLNMTISQGKGFWVKWKNTSETNVTIPAKISDLSIKDVIFYKYYTNSSSCNSAAYDKFTLKIDGTVSKDMYCYDGTSLASSPIYSDTSRTWDKTTTGFRMRYNQSTYWYIWDYSNTASTTNGFSATEHFTAYDGQDFTYSVTFDYTVASSSNTTTPSTETFNLSSTSFTNGNALPLKYAATAQGGQNVSPQLSWSGTQSNIGKYAIIMDDETSPCGTGDGACVHWNVFNIPASTTSFTENQSISAISGAIVGYAYNGLSGYNGPNPPFAHTYKITVYALSSLMPTISTSELSSNGFSYGMTRSQFEFLFSDVILNKSTMSTVFTPIN